MTTSVIQQVTALDPRVAPKSPFTERIIAQRRAPEKRGPKPALRRVGVLELRDDLNVSSRPVDEWPWRAIVEDQLQSLVKGGMHRVSDGGIHMVYMGGGEDMVDWVRQGTGVPQADQLLPHMHFHYAGGLHL
jgi:hypothetical protein